MLNVFLLIGSIATYLVTATPLPTHRQADSNRILYDQRQEDFLTRSHNKVSKPEKVEASDAAQETMHFIESKTAPYHVDITKTKEELAKLHPTTDDEVLVANSPSIALVKPKNEATSEDRLNPVEIRSGRFSRAFVLTVPTEETFAITNSEDVKKVVKKDGKKKATKDDPKHALLLLGAENEQCGPGMERDMNGVCRTYEHFL
ncbi:hypothetical protein NQ317_002621 [Molorchus minor]|uniref:Uncharacterized protein n=1 Tax=Molorchus minor TaxID=1323400 RepID=A0ABQ9IZ38_9CUCU|nr:hypothetical protein NQ317_002621 [Molorchus minor]